LPTPKANAKGNQAVRAFHPERIRRGCAIEDSGKAGKDLNFDTTTRLFHMQAVSSVAWVVRLSIFVL
jgi:hypothetical protein